MSEEKTINVTISVTDLATILVALENLVEVGFNNLDFAMANYAIEAGLTLTSDDTPAMQRCREEFMANVTGCNEE